MRLKISAKILLLMLCLLIFAPLCQAQTADAPPPNQNNITKENDRLPFMKSEQTAQTEEPSTGGLLFKTLGAMLLIVGLIFFGAWGLKKFGFGALKSNHAHENAPDLAVISSVSLGSGRTISTVQFGERVLLVGSTAQTFTLLADESGEASFSNDNLRNSPRQSPRSVAEMLDETESSFADELESAQNKFDFSKKVSGENGGRI